MDAYAQLYRNGVLEGVAGDIVYQDHQQGFLRITACEKAVVDCTRAYLGAFPVSTFLASLVLGACLRSEGRQDSVSLRVKRFWYRQGLGSSAAGPEVEGDFRRHTCSPPPALRCSLECCR